MLTADDLAAHDALALGARIARREVSVSEVVDTAISSIEQQNPRINAVVAERYDAARAEAGRMDREPPEAPGPLWGVPFLLKDVNLYSSVLPTRFASRFFADASPKGDSILVRRWRDAGLVILGTTNTPEFASDFTTEPLAYGPCRNPRDERFIVGGSSGGAAAAVASGMVPLAHATDLGGSIRVPAACCGIFGFKPSIGLNPLGPWQEEIASGLDSDHVLTRTVRDSAAALDLTAGPGAGTRLGRQPVQGGFLAALEEPLRPIRIGVATTDIHDLSAGAAQTAAVERVAEFFRDKGHQVRPYRYPPEVAVGAWFDLLWTMDIVHLVQERAAEIGREPREEELEPLTWQYYHSSRASSAIDYFRARLAMVGVAQALGRSMEGLDLVLTPTVAEDVPPLGTIGFQANQCSLERWMARGSRFAPYSTPANLAGQPAASCPVAVDGNGLPVGVQIAGRPGDDALVLRVAREIERDLGWHAPGRGQA